MKPSIPWKFMQVICRIFTTLMFDLKVYGRANVPAEGGVLLISNHQSYLDPVLLGVRLPRPVSYFAKAELFENPIFSWLITYLYAFPVKQGAGDVGAVKEAISRLHQGRALNIYPEGSRTEDGELLPIEKGVGLVIRRAKVPVVPVIIDGSFQAWPKRRKMFRPAPIRMIYGPPMDFEGLDRDQIIERIDRTFHQMLSDLRAGRIPASYRRERAYSPSPGSGGGCEVKTA